MADTRVVAKQAAVKAPPATAAQSDQVPSKKLGAFTAPHPVYTGGIYYEPGTVFVTSAPRGDAWTPASGIPAAQG